MFDHYLFLTILYSATGSHHPPSSMFYLVGTLNLLATLLQNGGQDVIDAAIGRRSDR
jgi:hypothetical protein